MPKTIMRSLTIKELSGVDRPAQIGARALILKRRGEPGYDPNNPDPKKRGRAPNLEDLSAEQVLDMLKRGRAVLTTAANGHTHLIALEDFEGNEVVSGITSWQDEHHHPWIRLEDDTIVIGEVDEHNHEPDRESKMAAATGEPTMTDKDKAAEALEAAKTENAELTKKLERAEKVAKLDDAAKAYFETLDEAGQNAFLEKSEDDRSAAVKAFEKSKSADDPVEYTTMDGVELRKSHGPAMIALAKSNDQLRKDNAELKKQREKDALEKRAADLLPNLPGSIEHRAEMLKSVEDIEDEDARETAMNALKASNAALDPAFQVRGSGGGDPTEGSAEDQLNKLAKKHQEANEGMSFEKAYSIVIDTDEGRRLYAKTVN